MNEEELKQRVVELAQELRARGLTQRELAQAVTGGAAVPATALKTGLSPLRSVVTYLCQEGMRLGDVAKTLHRSYRAVWGARCDERVEAEETEHYLPLSIFSEKHSVLEAAVQHLRKQGLRFSEIARLLGKDPRTVWTAWNRARQKDGNEAA